MNQKGFTIIEGLLAAALILVLGVGGYWIYAQNKDDSQPSSEFTDQLGAEQQISDFQDCMDWAMPWEVVNGKVVCSAPQGVEFTAACEDVEEVACVENENATIEGNEGRLYASDYRNELSRVLINVYIGAGFSDYWVEYGTSPDTLTQSTPKETGGLAMVSPDVYGGFAVSIPAEKLPNSDSGLYFYRVAGTFEGETVYTGVSTFNYK